MSTFRELMTNEVIKTHPNLKAMLPLFKNKGYKAKVQYGELNIPFIKGQTEEEVIEIFLSIAPGKWKEEEKEGGVSVYSQGDLEVSFGEFSGKWFAGVRT